MLELLLTFGLIIFCALAGCMLGSLGFDNE